MRNFKKRGIQMIITIAILATMLGITFFIVVPPSKGIIKPFRDQNGKIIENSIAEKVFVEINDSKQGIIIKGIDKNKPVLLIIHGGPGLTAYFLSTIYETKLDHEFVVCYWEQRGTGLSFDKDLDKNTMNTNQFLLDTIEVTKYLKERFQQEKIYIMGHSWGTYLGLMASKMRPDLYYAYIAMSQIVNMIESETEAYNYMLDRYLAENNKKMIKKMQRYNINNDLEFLNYRKSALRDETMHDLGVGTTHEMNSVVTGLFFPSLKCTEYTVNERINIWRGKVMSAKSMMLYTIDDFDARIDVSDLEIPIYFLAGIHDYTTSYRLQKDYFDKINAPIKGFYTFHQSSHSPIFEEPNLALSIFKTDVLNLKVTIDDLN